MRWGKCLSNFVSFLSQVSLKEKEEDISLQFKCENLSMSIVLIGKPEKMLHGCEPYTSYIRSAIKEGIKIFYVLARGRFNCFVADEVVSRLDSERAVRKTDEYRDELMYARRPTKVLCMRLEAISTDYNPFSYYFPSS